MDALEGNEIRETKEGIILHVVGCLLSNSSKHEGMTSIEMMSIYPSVALRLLIDHVHSTCDMTFFLYRRKKHV